METVTIDTVKGRVCALAAEKLGLEKSDLKPQSNFQDDLGVDSLDRVELFVHVEREFGIKLSEEEAERIRTVGGLCESVARHLS